MRAPWWVFQICQPSNERYQYTFLGVSHVLMSYRVLRILPKRTRGVSTYHFLRIWELWYYFKQNFMRFLFIYPLLERYILAITVLHKPEVRLWWMKIRKGQDQLLINSGVISLRSTFIKRDAKLLHTFCTTMTPETIIERLLSHCHFIGKPGNRLFFMITVSKRSAAAVL
jgi:hypothetical protein